MIPSEENTDNCLLKNDKLVFLFPAADDTNGTCGDVGIMVEKLATLIVRDQANETVLRLNSSPWRPRPVAELIRQPGLSELGNGGQLISATTKYMFMGSNQNLRI